MDFAKIIFSNMNQIEISAETIELFWGYLSSLYQNGQILKDYELIKQENTLIAYVTIPEKDSLDNKYNSIYTNMDLEKIEPNFKLSFEIIGENLNCEASCTCNKPSWYMLYSDSSSVESPVICGDCGKSVPLYKIPYLSSQQNHYMLVNWQTAFKCIDKIWFCSISDRFTYRQMNNPTSALSKSGREICSELEQITGIPFYYYLFHYKKTKNVCPCCGCDWKLISDNNFIDYKCSTCRLVADEV